MMKMINTMNLGAIKMLTEYARMKRFERRIEKINKENPNIKNEQQFYDELNSISKNARRPTFFIMSIAFLCSMV